MQTECNSNLGDGAARFVELGGLSQLPVRQSLVPQRHTVLTQQSSRGGLAETVPLGNGSSSRTQPVFLAKFGDLLRAQPATYGTWFGRFGPIDRRDLDRYGLFWEFEYVCRSSGWYGTCSRVGRTRRER